MNEDDELGLADRDRPRSTGPLGLARGLVGPQRRTDVEPQALVDRAGHAQSGAVLSHLLDELRAEHPDAVDPLLEAQVAAAREVGIPLRAGEREAPPADERIDPRSQGRAGAGWLRGHDRPAGHDHEETHQEEGRGGRAEGASRPGTIGGGRESRQRLAAEARMGLGGRSMKPVERWVEQVAATLRPDRVAWCDGSEAENARLVDQMLADGTLHAA